VLGFPGTEVPYTKFLGINGKYCGIVIDVCSIERPDYPCKKTPEQTLQLIIVTSSSAIKYHLSIIIINNAKYRLLVTRLVNWEHCRLTLKVYWNAELQKFPFDTQFVSILIESCEYNHLCTVIALFY